MCWSGNPCNWVLPKSTPKCKDRWVGSLLRDYKYMDGSSYKGGCLAKWSSPLLFVGCSNSLKCGQFVPKDFSLLWKSEFTSLDEAVSALCQYLSFFGNIELPGDDGLHFYPLSCQWVSRLVPGMWRCWLHATSPWLCWIELLDLSKLFHRLLKIDSCICHGCSMYFSPFAKQNQGKVWPSCASGNVLICRFFLINII